jgi:hypothetical protein
VFVSALTGKPPPISVANGWDVVKVCKDTGTVVLTTTSGTLVPVIQ